MKRKKLNCCLFLKHSHKDCISVSSPPILLLVIASAVIIEPSNYRPLLQYCKTCFVYTQRYKIISHSSKISLLNNLIHTEQILYIKSTNVTLILLPHFELMTESPLTSLPHLRAMMQQVLFVPSCALSIHLLRPAIAFLLWKKSPACLKTTFLSPSLSFSLPVVIIQRCRWRQCFNWLIFFLTAHSFCLVLKSLKQSLLCSELTPDLMFQ